MFEVIYEPSTEIFKQYNVIFYLSAEYFPFKHDIMHQICHFNAKTEN